MVTIIAGPHYTLEGLDHFNLLPYYCTLRIPVLARGPVLRTCPASPQGQNSCDADSFRGRTFQFICGDN